MGLQASEGPRQQRVPGWNLGLSAQRLDGGWGGPAVEAPACGRVEEAKLGPGQPGENAGGRLPFRLSWGCPRGARVHSGCALPGDSDLVPGEVSSPLRFKATVGGW